MYADTIIILLIINYKLINYYNIVNIYKNLWSTFQGTKR